jgi:hypothetical protein
MYAPVPQLVFFFYLFFFNCSIQYTNYPCEKTQSYRGKRTLFFTVSCEISGSLDLLDCFLIITILKKCEVDSTIWLFCNLVYHVTNNNFLPFFFNTWYKITNFEFILYNIFVSEKIIILYLTLRIKYTLLQIVFAKKKTRQFQVLDTATNANPTISLGSTEDT